MAGSSSLDPDNFPQRDRKRSLAKGHDTKSLGPSDSSDSGSDMAGPPVIDEEMDDNTDRSGTGQRRATGNETSVEADHDLGTDRIVGADEAGVGRGYDQAEEARMGITDEQLERTASSAKQEVASRKKGAKGAKATGHRKQPVART